MDVFITYYFLHTRKVLVVNIPEDEMTNILDDGQKMVSFSKKKTISLKNISENCVKTSKQGV